MTDRLLFLPGDYLMLHFKVRFKPTLWATLDVPGQSSPVTIRIPEAVTIVKRAGSTSERLEAGDTMVLRCKVLNVLRDGRASVRIPGYGPVSPLLVPENTVVERDPLARPRVLVSNDG